VPSQVLAPVPDPSSIVVPTGATVSAAPTATTAAPTGPTAGLTARQIWTRAAAAMRSQTSASVIVDTVNDQGVRLHATSSMAADGDCVGRFTAGGGHGRVIHVGQIPYVNADRLVWQAIHPDESSFYVRFFAGRWTGETERWVADLGDFGLDDMCDLTAATQDDTADFGGAMVKGAPRVVDGHRVVPVTQRSDSGSLTLDVAATGPAVVLRVTRPGANPTTVTFTGFGVPVHAQAPDVARA
jgi:hypothetical protein